MDFIFNKKDRFMEYSSNTLSPIEFKHNAQFIIDKKVLELCSLNNRDCYKLIANNYINGQNIIIDGGYTA